MKILSLILVLLVSTSLLACEETSRSLSIVDPADGSPFSVGIKGYWPQTTRKVPAVFILPPIVGETVIDRSMAEKFCKNGLAGLILNVVREIPKEEETVNLSIHDNSYLRALAGVRAVITSLETDPRLNGDFGILGMSLGGMLSAYVAGAESKIKASVIIVGAGNVAGVLTNSDQELVVAQREARMSHFGIDTKAEYEKFLSQYVSHDPLTVAGNIPPRSSYLFIARGDSRRKDYEFFS